MGYTARLVVLGCTLLLVMHCGIRWADYIMNTDVYSEFGRRCKMAHPLNNNYIVSRGWYRTQPPSRATSSRNSAQAVLQWFCRHGLRSIRPQPLSGLSRMQPNIFTSLEIQALFSAGLQFPVMERGKTWSLRSDRGGSPRQGIRLMGPSVLLLRSDVTLLNTPLSLHSSACWIRRILLSKPTFYFACFLVGTHSKCNSTFEFKSCYFLHLNSRCCCLAA